MSGGLPGWIGGFFSAIVSEVGEVFKDDSSNSNSEQGEGKSNSSNDINPLNWVREGLSEINSHVVSVFKDDAGGSNYEPVETRNNTWCQAFKFDPTTDYARDKIGESGCQGKAGVYLIRDENDEHTYYVGKAEGTSTDIYDRLVAHLTGSELGNDGIGERIENGETLTIRWVECDNPAQYESVIMAYLLPTDNNRAEYLGADRTRFEEEMAIGVQLDLPSFWHDKYENMVKEAAEKGLYVKNYGSNRIELAEAIFWHCNKDDENNNDNEPRSSIDDLRNLTDNDDDINKDSDSVDNNSDSEDSNVYYDLFGNKYEETSSSNTSDNNSSDSENTGGFWDFFGGSNSGSSDTSDNSSSDYGSSDTADNSSSDSGDTGGSWDLFGSSDYGSSDTSDNSSSDSNSDSSSDTSYSSSDWW